VKTVARTLCLALALGALWIPAPIRGDGASAAAMVLGPAPTSEPAQNQTVPPPAGDPPFRFDRILTEQGLSTPEVWSVLRDRRGFMWFGTLEGLDRYDGYTIKAFKHSLTDPSSLSDSAIRTLYEDRAGTLWIGTWNGGLNRYERGSETFTRFLHDPADPGSLSSNSVFAILEDRAGRLWLGTRAGGLDRFDPATGVFTHYRHDPAQATSLGDDNVFALLEDADDALWVGTGGGLDRFDPITGTFTHYRHNPDDPASLSNDTIRALFEDGSGALWVGTWGGGLDRFDRAADNFAHYRNDPNDPLSLSNDGVFSIQRDAMGALWVGTYGGGLNRLDPRTGTFRRFGPDDKDASGFGATQIFDMFGDAGTEWFATSNGVFTLDLHAKPFRVFRHDPDDANSLAANEIHAVYEDPQGILWAATASTGLNRIDRATGQVSHYQHDPADPAGVSENEIWEIAPARDGKLWLATYGGGLEKFDPETGQALHYRHDPNNAASLGSDRTTAVLEDRSGVVWVGTWDAGMDRLDPATETFTHFAHDPADPTGLSDNGIMTLVEGRNGELWIGTVAGGLSRFDPATGTFTRYQGAPGELQGLPSNSVPSVLLDRAGALWVGTWGGGLARLNPDTGEVTHYDQEDGLPSDAVASILEDGQGRLWLSTNNGLSRFDPRAGTFRNYDASDGLPGNPFEEVSQAFRSPGGEMFFGASDGLLAFYPEQIHDNLTVPPVVITDLLLANKPVAVGEGSVLRQAIDETDTLVLSYLDRVISFEFAALNYLAPQKNRYRYMLEGFDQGWTEVGSDRRLVTYTNLDPGKYVFRVIGSNNDGAWNESGAALALTITPPWWETIPFRLSMAFLVVGLVAGGFVVQRRRSAIQQRKLEAMVVERTHELQDARHQISTLFDNSPLGITLTNLEGKILGTNRAMRRITGYPEDELMQSDASVLYADPAQRAQVLDQVRMAGTLSDFGMQLRRRDGSFYYASVSLSRLEMAGQEVLLGIVDDVTDQVEAREALTTLHQISYDLASISDLQTLLGHAVAHLHQIVDFHRAALMLVEDGEESLTIYVYMSPALPPELTVHQVPVSSWPSLRAVLTGRETAYIQDMQASETIQADLDNVETDWWAGALKASRSWLGLPLLAGEHTIGLLNLLHEEANYYRADEIELARTFANQLAVAIDNIRLNEVARDAATARERSRIARELHDSVTQALYSMTLLSDATIMALSAGKLETVKERLDRIRDVAREAMTEMRWLIYGLHPPVLAEAGLAAALQERLEAVEARSGIKVHFQAEGQRRLPPASETELFWVAQEGLNNALKHARARQVWVLLDDEDGLCRLTIRDDGVGFRLDTAERYGGYGLANMRERLAKINGRLKIITEPGQGTTLEIEVDR
jgi:PAS domain S-box-containing protein